MLRKPPESLKFKVSSTFALLRTTKSMDFSATGLKGVLKVLKPADFFHPYAVPPNCLRAIAY